MRSRRLVTAFLLSLAVVSVAVAVVKELRRAPPAASAEPFALDDGVVVSYAHRTYRCENCDRAERLSRRVVEERFREDHQAGRMVWRKVNIDEDEAFARRYDVDGPSVVLVEFRDGKEVRSTALRDVLAHVGSEADFFAHVSAAIRSMSQPEGRVALWVGIGLSLWLGILTSISPCPLASNIAAISFVGRSVGRTRHALASGLLYTAGRAATYVVLAVVILAGLLGRGDVSRFLQKYMNQALGPILLLLGALLLGLLGWTLSLNLVDEGMQRRAAKGGVLWAGLLGILFALSFCPISAGLFFGGQVPLSARAGSRFLLPALYGIGTALPVIVFAFLIAFAAQQVGKAYNVLTIVERWARRVTGAVFILAGTYYCLTYIYGLSIRVR